MNDFATLKGEPAILAALAAGASVRDAANAGEVAESTVHRRLKNRDYVAELRRLRSTALTAAVGQLVDRMTEAVGVLVGLMRSAESEHVRLSAATKIIESAVRGTETVELAAELEDLRVLMKLEDWE